MKRNTNRKMSWAALSMVLVLAMTALPIVAQSPATEDQASDTRVEDTRLVADTKAPAEQIAGSGADEPTQQPIVNAPGPPAADAASPEKQASNERSSQAPSTDAILKRISQLEQLLQNLVNERGATDSRLVPAERESGATAASGTSPRLPKLDVSVHEDEQMLQGRLLTLDVDAARAEVQQANNDLQRTVLLNKRSPHTVAGADVERLQAALRYKEIQLKRSETVLELFKIQAARKRDESPGRKESRSSNAGLRNRQLADARLKLEFTRLKQLNQQAADEVARLEMLLKTEPDSVETRAALEEFLKNYRYLPQQDAGEDPNPMLVPKRQPK